MLFRFSVDCFPHFSSRRRSAKAKPTIQWPDRIQGNLGQDPARLHCFSPQVRFYVSVLVRFCFCKKKKLVWVVTSCFRSQFWTLTKKDERKLANRVLKFRGGEGNFNWTRRFNTEWGWSNEVWRCHDSRSRVEPFQRLFKGWNFRSMKETNASNGNTSWLVATHYSKALDPSSFTTSTLCWNTFKVWGNLHLQNEGRKWTEMRVLPLQPFSRRTCERHFSTFGARHL